MSKYIKETVVKDYVWDLLNDCGHGGLTPEDIDEQSTRCVQYMLLEKDCIEIVRCKNCMQNTINTDGTTLAEPKHGNEDLISRQDALDAIAKFVPYVIDDMSTESYTNGLKDAYNLIYQLPIWESDTE